MEPVSIFVDESSVQICRAHDVCNAASNNETPCDMRYLYGVGACVLESAKDKSEAEVRLAKIRGRISARTGIASARRMTGFVNQGWHATDDLPEFADPLIEEVDTDGGFKGHVRFVVLKERPPSEVRLYDHLFAQLLRQILTRYRSAARTDVVFERDEGRTLASYERLIDERFDNVIVSAQPKGDNLLALADYLLYASMRYAARAEELCTDDECVVSHLPPDAADIMFDKAGSPLPVGHVGKDDRWHKLYYAFVRVMSSVVKLTPAHGTGADVG